MPPRQAMPPRLEGLTPPVSEDDANAKAIVKAQAEADGSENDAAEPAPEPKREAIARRDQVWDKQGRRMKLVKSDRKDRNINKFSRFVLLVRRIYSEKGFYVDTEVDVKGTLLQKVLREIHENTKGFNVFGNPMTVDPKLLYHSSAQLLERLQRDDAQSSLEQGLGFEISAALQFVVEEYGSMDRDLKALSQKKEITWPLLWTFFGPQVLVYSHDALRQQRAFRVRSYKRSSMPDDTKAWAVECECIEFNGETMGTAIVTIPIPMFRGTIPIEDLPVYPFKYHKDCQDIRERFLKRAEKTLQLYTSKPLLQDHNGHGLTRVGEKARKFNSHGRIMVDPFHLRKLQPDLDIVPELTGTTNAEVLTDDDKLIVSAIVYGFSFGDKLWGAFAVDDIQPVIWNDEMYEALVMPPRQKELIFKLVKAHGTGRSNFDDFVRDKGKGLIGLLMGPPGLGKSLTAEAIAETAHKPLYMMSSGELGDNVTSIARNLNTVLELTTTWNAVLLIDEADVFLAERTELHLERNAVTSIFLRSLEYYPGILILTTNRASSFDHAFQSRIHFCFSYPHLDAAARKSIWKSFMAKARQNDGLTVAEDEDSLEQLSKLDLNGRQIKNAMSIAVTLAREDGDRITAQGILDISMTLQDFQLGSKSALLQAEEDLISISRRSTQLSERANAGPSGGGSLDDLMFMSRSSTGLSRKSTGLI